MQAASITVTYMTAHYGFMHLAKILRGEKVLIHSSAGGVGIAALQIANMVGCEIFGTASTPKKHAVSRSFGAKHMCNSRTLDFADEIKAITNGEGVDVILNTLNNEFIPKSLEVLKKGGRFIEIGKAGVWTKEQMKAYRPDVQFWHFDLVEMWETNRPIIKQMFDELTPDFAAGRLKPLPITVFPFDEAAMGFRYMQKAKHIGKIIISHRGSTGAEVRDTTTWTVLQNDGPDDLGLRYNVPPAHQMALITSGLCALQAGPPERIRHARGRLVELPRL